MITICMLPTARCDLAVAQIVLRGVSDVYLYDGHACCVENTNKLLAGFGLYSAIYHNVITRTQSKKVRALRDSRADTLQFTLRHTHDQYRHGPTEYRYGSETASSSWRVFEGELVGQAARVSKRMHVLEPLAPRTIR